MTLDPTAILLEVFPFLENCVKTELKTLMILEISLQKKIPNCNGLIYHSGPEIETSEMDCQAPARFSFSSFFHFFFFLLYLGKKQFPYSHKSLLIFSVS